MKINNFESLNYSDELFYSFKIVVIIIFIRGFILLYCEWEVYFIDKLISSSIRDEVYFKL